MASESLLIAIMASSITGAGLVIAFYALIARMSDRLFETKIKQLDKKRLQLKEITCNQESFMEKNLRKTTKRLDELRKEINSISSFPKYLGYGVLVDFLMFVMTAIASLSQILRTENVGTIASMNEFFITTFFFYRWVFF